MRTASLECSDNVQRQTGRQVLSAFSQESPRLATGKLADGEGRHEDRQQQPTPSEKRKPEDDRYGYGHVDGQYPLFGEAPCVRPPITEEGIHRHYGSQNKYGFHDTRRFLRSKPVNAVYHTPTWLRKSAIARLNS